MAIPLNLLQIVNTAFDELGLNRTSVVANSTDLNVRRLFALLNRELREQQKDKEWTMLQAEYDLHVGQPLITVGDTHLNSYQIINIPDTTSLMPGVMLCAGQNLPSNSRVQTVDTPTQVTLFQPATGTAAQVPLTFAQDTYPQPIGFDRFINQTWWDRTNHWALFGPDSPQMDQWHRSGIVTVGPRRHFRQVPGYLGSDFSIDFGVDFNVGLLAYNYRLWPPPGALDTPLDLVFEYMSNLAVYGSQGVAQTTFQADTDICVLDSDMLILGAKWRMWQIQGFDYQPMQQEYLDYVARLYAQDGGAKTLNLAQPRASNLITSSQVPDGFWAGPVGANER